MTLIIKGGKLFDGLGACLTGRAVVIEGGKVRDVLHIEQLPVESSAQVIDAAGCTVMPGLIDCHIHICESGAADSTLESLEPDGLLALRGAHNAGTLLGCGFTTVRSLGTQHHVDIALREAIARGYVRGPRILAAGEVITMTGGHGWRGGRQVDGPDEARKAAREQLRAGADVIKIMATGGVMTPGVDPGSPQLTIEEMRAAVEEAHKAGRRTTTHAQGTVGIQNAILAGLDCIDHGIFLDEKTVEMMLARNVALVPTLVAPYHIVRGGIEAGIPAYAVEKAQRIADTHRASFRLALQAGVTIAFGTDCGTPLNQPGQNALELEQMVAEGMTPTQALMAATSVAARVIDREHLIGSIEAGKLADVLVVRGDVTQDVTLLQDESNILRVVKDGVICVAR
ncbi:MAG: amidohydrolase family protein [Bacillota bacterium]|jgi:imidazolonepropionase-like amidohydrolase